ncbi:MAG: phosphoribosylformylglycinamidine synthase [Kofleriaceae bacterium]|nr:phosphoribosylformylglycinamidine synthase [Kofleriaceae bacterium]
MIVIPGRAALSAARKASTLAKVRAVSPEVTSIDARWVHLVVADRTLTQGELDQLGQMLSYGPAEAPQPPSPRLETVETVSFVITPRLGTVSPWSSKATDIARVCGLSAVTRIERGLEYAIIGKSIDVPKIAALLSDRMTESVIMRETDLHKVVGAPGEPRPLAFVALGADGAKTLREASNRLGLALADDEIEYLVARYGELGRDPTDVELMMFAQANSEHCRHKIFNAEWFVSGEKMDRSLFSWIKRSTENAPTGVLSAYKDNAAVVEGHVAERFFPDADGVYRGHEEPSHILGKVETHNHPTAISPFPGAATGSGGEIRDEGATGRGAKPKAGLVGFTVSDLRIPGALEPWERSEWIGSPARIATALDIMIDGPLGGAAFNNEFGRPAILGYFRTFELGDRGYHKPVMLAGGIGAIRPSHVQKAPVPAGAALVVLGGPAFLIGLGGGAASSLAQGASTEDLDFASVQRDNPEIQRRCQEVIDRCWAMGEQNPILSIHDVGAGGLSNAMPELVHDAGLGAKLDLRKIPTGESDLSPLELWCNESQERYVMAIAPERIADFAALCERERAPWAQLGTATGDGRLTLADSSGGPAPVDLALDIVFGKPPRMTRRAEPVPSPRRPLELAGASVSDALDRVLGLPTVADKSFLVTIGDRTVGGLVSRDPMVGRFQVPVADCALTTAGFDTYAGEVMSMGERPPVALLDAAAASRLAIAEAITNLAAAPIGELSRIKLSCNWMAAAGHPGEDARLYAGVRAASETSVALGIAIPVGKDSMSMRTQWTDAAGAKAVVSPVTLVVTAFGPVTDVRKNVTPELRGIGELLLVDLGAGQGRLGGSCLAQVYGQLGDAPPDLDDPARLHEFYAAMQSLVAHGKIAAYHDRSDGGAIITALEMAFAGGVALELDMTAVDADPFRALFAEELGAILEVAPEHLADVKAALAGLTVHSIGRAVPGDRIHVVHRGQTLIEAPRRELRARWSHVTHQIARRRDDEACADEEQVTRIDARWPGLTAELTFDPAADIAAPYIARGARPRVAVLREQGVNGQIEMAAAFTRAGFEAVDVHMTDLIEGRADLRDVRGALACGGFSFGDVFGAGRGWAATFRYNPRAQAAIRAFVDRPDTFVLGVCNGCQMVADLAPDLVPATRGVWPRFVKNRSERFEAREVLVRLEESPSLFFKGMAGSRIPIANSHGEGRAEFASAAQLDALEAQGLVAARYVDGHGDVTEMYPANPNGSPHGIASITTADGRVTVIMPHPERVFRTVQMSWHPPEWGEDSPWMRMFRNARAWVD